MLAFTIEMGLLLVQFILLQTSGFYLILLRFSTVSAILVLYFPLFFVWTTLNHLNYHAQKYLKILLKRKKANQKNLKSFTFLLFYVYEDEAQGVYLS